MKPKYSIKDNKGRFFVDCTECRRGYNCEKDCSSGFKIKEGNQGGCFCGLLMTKFDADLL